MEGIAKKTFFAPSPWNIMDMMHNFRQFDVRYSLQWFKIKDTELQPHITWYDIRCQDLS